MRYVLDTNVVSALRVRGSHPAVETWAASIPVTDQFITAMTVAELERGIIAEEGQNPPQGKALRVWFTERVLPTFEQRVLAFDLSAARVLATYRVLEHAPYDDALVAAVAESNQMVVATRNTRPFSPLGTRCVDPWSGSTTDRCADIRSP